LAEVAVFARISATKARVGHDLTILVPGALTIQIKDRGMVSEDNLEFLRERGARLQRRRPPLLPDAAFGIAPARRRSASCDPSAMAPAKSFALIQGGGSAIAAGVGLRSAQAGAIVRLLFWWMERHPEERVVLNAVEVHVFGFVVISQDQIQQKNLPLQAQWDPDVVD
jgi:hypothetical protein